MTHTMTREKFYEFAADGIKGYIPEEYSKIEIFDTQNSSFKYKGMTVRKEGLKSAYTPVVNLDMFYDDYFEKIENEELFKKMADIVFMDRPDFGEDPSSYITDWDKVKDRLFITVTRMEKLNTTVFRPLAGDIVIVARVLIGNKNGLASAVVTDHLAQAWEQDDDSILDYAVNNSKNLLDVEIKKISDVIPVPDDGPSFYIVSNETKTQGAAALFYPGVMKHIADDIIKGSYYVIPSSIHEMLIIPEFGPEPDDLRNMVKSVNDNELDSRDILSYDVFHYDIATAEFKEV